MAHKSKVPPLKRSHYADVFDIVRLRPTNGDHDAWHASLQKKYPEWEWSISTRDDDRFQICKKNSWSSTEMLIPASCIKEFPKYDAYIRSKK